MISIETTGRFRRCVRELDAEDVAETMRQLTDGFGKPHLHAGLGIRKLANHVFECRTGLKARLVFLAEVGRLVMDFAGNHDQVRAYLKERH